MNPQELRELDAWIAENLFRDKKTFKYLAYSTDPASAMLVLDKCRCVDSVHIMPPTPDAPCEIWGGGMRVKADTLALAICLFAKNLFSK